MTDMTTDTPKIWIGCLAAYNNGHLHGEWVDATDEDELNEARERVLRTSPISLAEEPYIGDYDGFGEVGRMLGEYASMADVANVGALIEEHGEKFIAFVGTLDYGADLGEVTEDDFMEHYRGEWESEEGFAMEHICEVGWGGVPAQGLGTGGHGPDGREIKINVIEELISYLDMELIARELFQHGNYTSVRTTGGIYVFEQEV